MSSYCPTGDDSLDKTRNVYLKIKLVVKPGVDVDNLIENMDYYINDHDDRIVETEILGYGYRSYPE
jgi:hypothetical protein